MAPDTCAATPGLRASQQLLSSPWPSHDPMGGVGQEWRGKLLNAVEGSRDELLKLACAMVRTPSENPPGDQTQVMGVVEDYLHTNGIAYDAPYLHPDRRNILARIGGDGSKSLILYGHTDTVPVGNPALWSFPPFVGDIHDGRIRGRGAVDMKAGTAACLFVTVLLAHLEIPLAGRLILHANPDEEDFLPEDKLLYKLLEDGRLRATACIMAEPSGLGNIGVADKGDLWLRLRSRGHSTHGSSPMLGDSAVEACLEAVRRLGTMAKAAVAVPPELQPLLPASRASARARAKAMGLGGRAAAAAAAVDHTTVNVGRIKGGSMINIVPEECEVEVALCVPPGISLCDLEARIKEAVVGLAEVEMMTATEPNFSPPDDPIVGSVQRSSNAVLGRPGKPVIFPATSDAHAFRPRGIATLFYGPGDLGLAHALDERVSVEETVAAAKILALAAVDYLASSKGDPGRGLQAG